MGLWVTDQRRLIVVPGGADGSCVMTGYLERSVPDCCRKSLIACIDVVINYSRASRYRLREPHSNGDCERSVHESYVFITLGFALSKKQIPQIVENIGNQNSGWSQ